jgi:hypothetical protein
MRMFLYVVDTGDDDSCLVAARLTDNTWMRRVREKHPLARIYHIGLAYSNVPPGVLGGINKLTELFKANVGSQ